MPFYNAELLRIYNGTTYTNCKWVQSLSIDTQLTTSDNSYINVFDLEARPLISYPSINCRVNLLKTDKEIENSLGLISGNSILSNLLTSNGIGSGLNTYQIIVKDPFGVNDSGATITIPSGALTSYNLNLAVGEVPKSSFSFEGLDLNFNVNSLQSIDLGLTGSDIIRKENNTLSFINLSGFGISEISVQNLSLDLQLNRNKELYLGDKYPKKRNLISPIIPRLSMDCLVESFTNLAGLEYLFDGQFYTGDIVIVSSQSCVSGPITTTYTIKNPFISQFSLNGQIGGYTQFSLSLEIPININGNINRSNITIT